ncbi:hypothetical protein LOD99_934 [Oopsacas minuta]|uniref:Uncharacterized protein n=1 Tax=Oopsacas minuta TaxID=111878 RepID=A0AAV7JZY9_9METZ|nr:hypothetical protein LOD99_934 [Oopsacas minuta]
MAQRYENNEPEVGDSCWDREQYEQLAFGFMAAKAERQRDRCTSESEKQLLDTFHTELSTVRHERVPSNDLVSETSDTVSPSYLDSDPGDSPPAERVGAVLGELGDVLEHHSNAVVVPTEQDRTPVVPFFLNGPTQVPFSELKERIDQAVNRIAPSQSTASGSPALLSESTQEPPVPPLPPLESSTFNSIARELIQVTEGMRLLPGQLAICLYFCYRLGVRLLSQHIANHLGLGNTLRNLMETCVQFLVEQQLLHYVQQRGGWASYIEQWIQSEPNGQIQQFSISTAIGYVGVGIAIGFALGFLVRSFNS